MEWKVPRAMFTEFYLVFFFFKLDSVLTELKPYTAVKCTEICFHTRFFLWKEKSLGRCLPSFFLPSFGVARRWPVCAQRDTLRASSFSSVSFFFTSSSSSCSPSSSACSACSASSASSAASSAASALLFFVGRGRSEPSIEIVDPSSMSRR